MSAISFDGRAAWLTNLSVTEPILITTCGIILAGTGRWQSALLKGRQEINCIEYSLGEEEEALQFIISHHQPQPRWNAFIRIRLALTLEPYFQQRARDNMKFGGKYKGLANLPEAQHIDVRQDISRVAGPAACARNVSNVKTILQTAHPRLIEALTEGRLTINRAVSLCKLPKGEQVEKFAQHTLGREISKVISESICQLTKDKESPDLTAILDAVQKQAARQPGSVVVRVGRLQRTVILIGQGLLADPHSQTRPNLA